MSTENRTFEYVVQLHHKMDEMDAKLDKIRSDQEKLSKLITTLLARLMPRDTP